LKLQGFHINDKTVADITFLHSVVGSVNILDIKSAGVTTGRLPFLSSTFHYNNATFGYFRFLIAAHLCNNNKQLKNK